MGATVLCVASRGNGPTSTHKTLSVNQSSQSSITRQRYYLKLLFSLGVMWRGGVSIRVMTSNIRVKRSSDKEVMFEFPLFRVSYCGTDRRQKEVFGFVAKETDGR